MKQTPRGMQMPLCKRKTINPSYQNEKHHNRCNDQMQDDTQQDMHRERHMSVNEQSLGRMLDTLCLDTGCSEILLG